MNISTVAIDGSNPLSRDIKTFGFAKIARFRSVGLNKITVIKRHSYLRAGVAVDGFGGVCVFERLSRDLRPSLCAVGVVRQCHLKVPSIAAGTLSLNSSVLCVVRSPSVAHFKSNQGKH